MPVDTTARWSSPEWRAEAERWIDAALADQGIRRTGPTDQPRIRFWSTQLTVPTTIGQVWFKENNEGQTFEAGLIEVLARLVPEHVVRPLAIEARRGWLLTTDQGPTLVALPEFDLAMWTRLATDFADLQRKVSGHRDELLGAGLPELPPGQLSHYVDEQLALLQAQPADDPRHIDAELAATMRAALPRLEHEAGLLAAGPIPLSLEHNDLHHNNVFQPKNGTAPLRFFDFGDALWAHPFCSMRITANVMALVLDVEKDDPRIAHVIDAYLEIWTDLASRDELAELMSAALSVGLIHRVVSWQRVLPFADEAGLAEFGDGPGETIKEYLEPPMR